jgi:hypothetical protein
VNGQVEPDRWLEPTAWARDGRGRDWQFYIATTQLIEALDATAAEVGERLELLACSRVQDGRESLSTYSIQRLDELTLEGAWQYFLRLASATPVIPAPEPIPGVGWPARFAINGLVLLHHPDPGKRSEPPRSSIGITHRVVNTATGESREHDQYDDLFKRLKRQLRAAGAHA